MTEQTSDRRVLLTPALHVKIERPIFLLADIVPLQVLSLLTGIAGEGKSSLALYWAALATRGLLPGEYYGRPINVVISATEDAKGLQIARLKANGADLGRVTFMDMGIMVAGEQIEQPIVFPRDMLTTRQALEDTGARLWIIDPITGIIPGDSNSRDAVRHSLDPLHALARDLNMSVLGVAHFNKGSGKSGNLISGSHAFRDVARAHIPLVVDSESGHRVYTLEKSNYSTQVGKSWSFDLVDTEVDAGGGETMHVGRVVDLGESDITVDQVINRSVDHDSDDEDRNAAQEFLLDYLMDNGGEVKAGDALKAGRAAGFNDNEIKNARKRSRNPRIESRKAGGKGVGWVWAVENDTFSDTFEYCAPDQQKVDTEISKVSKESRAGESDTFDEPVPTLPLCTNGKSKVSPLIPNDTLEPVHGYKHCDHCGHNTPDNSGGLKVCANCHQTLQSPPKLEVISTPQLTSEHLGTVVGSHSDYGQILYTKAGLVPKDTSGYQQWGSDGKPDLSSFVDLGGVA